MVVVEGEGKVWPLAELGVEITRFSTKLKTKLLP